MSNDAESAVDPDVDLHIPTQRRELTGAHLRVLGVIAAGGGIGALARYGIETLLPVAPGGFPWTTFLINVSGCALIGVLMVLVNDVFTGRPLLRPFVGVGVLGGFTSFSTYTNEVRGLLRPGALPVAFVYLAGTVVCALLAVLIAMAATRALLPKKVRVAA
ncbi:MAG TPA: CrcB family protein [Pseudonocardiaceae bacterium]|nr:CrcB family protein [Pseudonocardiaceae bacterium]